MTHHTMVALMKQTQVEVQVLSVYWRHYKQQLELELQGPRPLLFMN